MFLQSFVITYVFDFGGPTLQELDDAEGDGNGSDSNHEDAETDGESGEGGEPIADGKASSDEESNHDDDTTLVLGEGSPGACPTDDSEGEDDAAIPSGSNGSTAEMVCQRFGHGKMCDGRGCQPCYEALHYKTPPSKRSCPDEAVSVEKRAKIHHGTSATWTVFLSVVLVCL